MNRAYTGPMATTTRRSQTGRARGRFRTRTWLRGVLPGRLNWLVPKGATDCGAHEFYNHDDVTDRCYHCRVGERVHEATRLTASAREMLECAEAAGSAAAGRTLAERG